MQGVCIGKRGSHVLTDGDDESVPTPPPLSCLLLTCLRSSVTIGCVAGAKAGANNDVSIEQQMM